MPVCRPEDHPPPAPTPRPADVRVGIVGYGLAGRVFHGRLLAVTPGVRVVAVVTRDPDRQAQARADLPGVRVYAELSAALRAGLDLVVIATPNATHPALAAQALQAGVATVVDKPLAVTAADATRLVELAGAQGVPLTVFQNRRWDADVLTLVDAARAGRLGQIRRFESRFERWRPHLDAGKWREVAPAESGGGILVDLGSHLVDQALHLFGDVTAVYAEVDARRGGADDDVFLALTHGCGVRSHLWCSAVAGSPGPRMRVSGSAGALVVQELDGQEAALRAGRRADQADRPVVRLVRGPQEEALPAAAGRWSGFYPAVVAAVRGQGPVPVDPYDAVRCLQVLEAARRSAATGGIVRPSVPGGTQTAEVGRLARWTPRRPDVR